MVKQPHKTPVYCRESDVSAKSLSPAAPLQNANGIYRTERERQGTGQQQQVQLLKHDAALSHHTALRRNRGVIVAL